MTMTATDRSKLHRADTLSPEAQLLLAAAGGPGQDERIRRLLEGGINWPRLVAISLQEGAQPVLGRRLRALGADLMPPEIATDLRQIERVGEFRQRYLQRRLREATGTLAEAGIEVMLLKGAALAQTAYSDFGERPMSDVDLLVHQADAQRARGRLLTAGWAPRFDDSVDDLYEGMHHLPPLVDTRTPGLQVGLDLHTELFAEQRSPFRFDADQLWRQSRPAANLPSGVMISSPENHLLHACVHHAWSHRLAGAGWRTFRDIDTIAGLQDFSWERFLEAVNRAQAAVAVYWSLRLAKTLSGVPVPEEALAQLEPRRARALLALLVRHFSHEAVEAEQICPSHRLRRQLWMRAMGPSQEVRRAASPDRRSWHRLKVSRPQASAGEGRPRPALQLSAWFQFVRKVSS